MSAPLDPIDADLSSKRVIVTGATAGIGKEAAWGLAKLGAEVVLVGRNAAKLEATRDELVARGATRDKLAAATAELSSVASVHRLADELLERYGRIDALLNNAGCYPDARRITPEGHEEAWATNVLAYEVLTTRLVDRLAEARGRIVLVASTKAGQLDMHDLDFSRRRFGGVAAYEQSKQANRMLAWAWQRKLAGRGLTINVAHPGGVATSIANRQKGLWGAIVRLAFKTQRTPEMGADTLVWLVASPELEGKSGGFYKDRRAIPCKWRGEVAAQDALWQRCQEQIARR
jgi:NAD(P)-dependent dehydrogenase (short-subunit alcohol dehydrogenase family)